MLQRRNNMDKKELRRSIRERKRAMTEEEIVSRSEKLAELFYASEAYKNAKTIYGYLPYNQEVRTVPMLERALLDGKRVAVPKCYGNEMKFIFMEDLSKVEKGYANIPEPIADDPVADDTTALVLMPGLAFDPQGHRCGYGGGFYDKFLAAEPEHPTLALCYEFQMLSHLETEEHDIPVDYVLWA
jgi:5-formyltetrahydrofolate cyclo-ligase